MQRRAFLTASASLGCVGLTGLLELGSGCAAGPSAPGSSPGPASTPHGPGPTEGPPRPNAERVLDEGWSEFNHVIVTQQGSVRKMYFETDGLWLLQTTYDLERPDALHHAVFQTMVSALLLTPKPARMCMVGLGGGQLSNYLHRNLPELELDVVEICPEVVRLAKAWFGVPDDPRYRVHVDDGRVFVESLPAASLDLLVLDAYRGHSIPKHLRTQEFFAACATRLSPDGALVANMHRRTPRYRVDRATLASVFRHVYRFSSANDRETSVVATMSEAAQTPAQLAATAAALQPDFDFDLAALASRCLVDEDEWKADPIHDDFAPSELDDAAREHNLSCAPRCEGDRRP